MPLPPARGGRIAIARSGPIASTAIHPAIDPLTAAVEAAIDRFTAPVEPAIDAVTTAIEVGGRDFVAVARRDVRCAIETPIGAIAAAVEATLRVIAATIETPFDAVASVDRDCVLRPRLDRAKKQCDTQQQSITLHVRTSLNSCQNSSHTTGQREQG